jgi:hypothetical protein
MALLFFSHLIDKLTDTQSTRNEPREMRHQLSDTQIKSLYKEAILTNNVRQIDRLVQCGYPMSNDIMMYAADIYKPDVIKCLYLLGCPCNENVMTVVVSCGDYELVKWLNEHGAPWDNRIIAIAKNKNFMDIVKYANSHGLK